MLRIRPRPMSEAALLRCSECNDPVPATQLVCPRCSTRKMATISENDESVIRRTPGSNSLDAALAALELRAGERAHSIDVEVNAILGGPGHVIVRVVLAPEGPDTPLEDVWGEPEVLSDDAELGPDERAARLGWVQRMTDERGLRPGKLEERYRLGLRDDAVDAETIPLLLGARLKSATLFLEGFTLDHLFVDAPESHPTTARCTALFRHARGRELNVELIAVPDADDAARALLDAFVTEPRG